jgi:hypothetical protein
MPTQRNLMGTGCPAQQSQASVGIVSNGLTATGSSLATALMAPSDFMVFSTVPASTGVALPADATRAISPADSYIAVNHGANSLSVYPGTASGKIANGSAGAAFSVAATKTATFLYLGSDNWAASVSA